MNAMWDPLDLGDKKKRSVGADKKQLSGNQLCVEMYDCIDKFMVYAQEAGGGPKNASDHDEFQAAKFFESQDKDGKAICGTTMTRSEKLEAFKHIDLDGNKRYSLIEVLVWSFKVD